MIRDATLEDLDALVDLETHCFDSDRMTRRSFRRMITRAKSTLLVDEEEGGLRGYALVLFHAGTPLARLYSIAVDPRYRGQGVASALMTAVEEIARERGCVAMRLELRRDNTSALALYTALGYRQFEIQADYYEDHMDAIRMEKPLTPEHPRELVHVPYYRQTLEFTCGPAALLMAMHALDPTLSPDRKLELRIWRESTTIYMTSGHGGCGPYGLALSAHHRGFKVEVWASAPGPELFVDTVRSEEKKTVIRLVQEDFIEEVGQVGIPLHDGQLGMADLEAAFASGGIPIVLISSYRIYKERFPHWVVVTGFDERFVYVHDPYVDEDENKTRMDCENMPIHRQEFLGMARYGRKAQRAAVIVRR